MRPIKVHMQPFQTIQIWRENDFYPADYNEIHSGTIFRICDSLPDSKKILDLHPTDSILATSSPHWNNSYWAAYPVIEGLYETSVWDD